MFGSGGGGGKKPNWIAPPPYQNAPTFQNADPAGSSYNSFVPKVETGAQVVGNALGVPALNRKQIRAGGKQSAEGNLDAYAPWLNLQNNPTDAQNMASAEKYYLQTQGLPQLASDASALYANGQGNSSYGGAYLGQEAAMNNLNAFTAGLNQQQNDFGNVLNARNSLYSGPIGLEAQQNANNVQRGLGISGLALQESLGQNQYNLSNNQGLNSYNLQSTLGQNNFNSNNYGISTQAATARNGQGLGLIGTLGSAYLGSLR